MLYFWIYLAVIIVFAFVMYGIDKRKAKEGAWRVRESVLLLLAAAGGSVGALFGMLVFHHKTKKAPFKVRIAIILVLQVIAVGAWLYLRNPALESPLIRKDGATLAERFATPEGFVRAEAPAGSMTAFLRGYAMEPHGSRVKRYDGRTKSGKTAVAVFSMHLGTENLQQCADSVMRMYAEYLRASGREDEIAFHFVSGFLCDWPTYRSGKRVTVDGNDVQWYDGAAESGSDETFESYLELVFNYASTLSLWEESAEVPLAEVQVGDIFLRAGSPGHVVMVVDVCEKDGRKAFLLAQGSMPAQQFHVIRNDAHADDPWYYVDEITYPFETPEYTFDRGSFRRPVYLTVGSQGEDEK